MAESGGAGRRARKDKYTRTQKRTDAQTSSLAFCKSENWNRDLRRDMVGVVLPLSPGAPNGHYRLPGSGSCLKGNKAVLSVGEESKL